MYNMIKYLLLLTTAVFVIVDGEITYGCYSQPESPCSQHTLACSDREVIALDNFRPNIAYHIKNVSYACRQDKKEICNGTCCRSQGRNDDFISVNQSYRLSVYRNCSNKRTCTVTSPYSPDTDYDYIRYIYKCLPVIRIHNTMEITVVSFLYKGYLYYSGKTQTTGTTITRCCNITSSEPIIIESVYIDLTEESSYNVKIYSGNQTLIGVGDGGGLLYGSKELSISGDMIYHVVFDNLSVDEDDYIWMRITSNSVIIITCDDSTASDNQVYNMMEITYVRFSSISYLYYSGRTQTKLSTRCCNITSPDPITIESVYIYLTEDSSYNVKIYSGNQTLLRCIDEGGIFYGFGELSISGDTIYHVVLDNLRVETRNYIWIRITADSNISITCDECAAFTASAPQMNECRSESGCYGEPGSQCSKHTLTCDEGQVISIDERNEKRKIHYGTKFNPSCNASLDTASCNVKKCCRKNIKDEHSPVDRDDRLQVYKNCSNKRTCSLTSPYTPGAKYNYIYYPYICISDNIIYDIVNIDSTILPDEAYLYISSQHPYSGNYSCSLISLQTVRIESVFINLSEKSCSKIQIFSRNQDLLNCSTDVIILGPKLKLSGKTITVKIENFTDEEESIMWIKVYRGPSISCIRYLAPGPVPERVPGSSDELGIIIGCVVGVVVVVLVVVFVYCTIRKRKQKRLSRADQNNARAVNIVETSAYTGLVNNGRPEHDYSDLVNRNPSYTVNNGGPEYDYSGLVNGPDTVNNSGPEHDCTGLVNRNGSDPVNSCESVHGYINMVNRNGSDPANSGESVHGYINLVNRNGSDPVNKGEREQHYTGLVNRDRSDHVNSGEPEHDYTGLGNRDGSDSVNRNTNI